MDGVALGGAIEDATEEEREKASPGTDCIVERLGVRLKSGLVYAGFMVDPKPDGIRLAQQLQWAGRPQGTNVNGCWQPIPRAPAPEGCSVSLVFWCPC